jgi:hypothetical protein
MTKLILEVCALVSGLSLQITASSMLRPTLTHCTPAMGPIAETGLHAIRLTGAVTEAEIGVVVVYSRHHHPHPTHALDPARQRRYKINTPTLQVGYHHHFSLSQSNKYPPAILLQSSTFVLQLSRF